MVHFTAWCCWASGGRSNHGVPMNLKVPMTRERARQSSGQRKHTSMNWHPLGCLMAQYSGGCSLKGGEGRMQSPNPRQSIAVRRSGNNGKARDRCCIKLSGITPWEFRRCESLKPPPVQDLKGPDPPLRTSSCSCRVLALFQFLVLPGWGKITSRALGTCLKLGAWVGAYIATTHW